MAKIIPVINPVTRAGPIETLVSKQKVTIGILGGIRTDSDPAHVIVDIDRPLSYPCLLSSGRAILLNTTLPAEETPEQAPKIILAMTTVSSRPPFLRPSHDLTALKAHSPIPVSAANCPITINNGTIAKL